MNFILDSKISTKGSYDIAKQEFFRIPIVSDVMFNTMINNSERIKYAAYIIALSLNISYDEVMSSISMVNNNLDHDKIKDPRRTVDFLCKVNDEYVGIEMNNYDSKEALERNLSYAFDTFKKDSKSGDERYNFKRIVQININNFVFEGTKDTVEKYFIKNQRNIPLTNKIEIIYIYLPKIKEKYYNKEELSSLERFMLVASDNNEEVSRKLCGDDKIMKEYLDDSLVISKDEATANLYSAERRDAAIKAELNERSYDDGRDEGIEIGIQKRNEEIAKSLLENNIDLKVISKCTNLTVDEIKKL